MRPHALVRSSLCALLWLLAGAVQAQGTSVLVLHNNFVSSEKFQLLQRLTTFLGDCGKQQPPPDLLF